MIRLICTPTFRVLSTALLVACTATISFAKDPAIALGKEIFQREWTHNPPPELKQQENQTRRAFAAVLSNLPGDGLGPMFNATSCEACHALGGASGVDHNVTLITIDPRSPILQVPEAQKKETKQFFDALYPGLISPSGQLSLDVVVHEASSRHLYGLIREQIRAYVPGGVADQWYKSDSRTSNAIADQPVVAGRSGDIDFYLSQRNSPPLFGLGLIDRIERASLMKIARNQARRSYGRVTGRLGTGRFGWRAQTTSLQAFVRGACAGEVGLQLAATPQPGDVADDTYLSLGVDLTEPEVMQLVSYVQDLPRPIQETKLPAESIHVSEGKRLFGKIGCAACHVETILPARGLYSDLLLHDMGSLLQAPSPSAPDLTLTRISPMRIPTFRPEVPPLGSGLSIGGYYGAQSASTPVPYALARPIRPQFPYGKPTEQQVNTASQTHVPWDVLQREWRTAPLWGVADSAPYLHDGRAETLDAAIRWHGGEAHESATNYRTLSKESRRELIAFLKSLRSPSLPHRFAQDQLARQPKSRKPVDTFAKSNADEAEQGSVQEALQMFEDAF